MKALNAIRKTGTVVAEAGVFGLLLTGSAFAAVDPGAALQDGLNRAGGGDTSGTGGLLEEGGIFERIATALIILIGAVSVIMLIVGGFRYVISQGDSSAVEGAKNTILYAIVGIVVAFLSYAAVDFVITQLTEA